MKLCLIFMCQNEAHWLKLHLPVLLPHFDGAIAIDGGSVDGTVALCQQHGVHVIQRPFEGDYSAQINTAVQAAEDLGFDAVLRLDPDECVDDRDARQVRRDLSSWHGVGLYRTTLERDRDHYHEAFGKDIQWRGFRLNCGIRFEGIIHESAYASMRDAGQVSTINALIFHYEGLNSPAYKASKYTGVVPPNAKHRAMTPFSVEHPYDVPHPRYPFPERDVTPHCRAGTRIFSRDYPDIHVLQDVQDNYLWDKLPPMRRVLDIGGHIGTFGLEVKKRYPDARITVVEPEPENVQMLDLHLGHYLDVNIVHGYAWYTEGNWALAKHHVYSSGHVIVGADFVSDVYDTIPLTGRRVTLEDLAPDGEPIDVLKLDCEGAEMDILLHVGSAFLDRVQCIVGERHRALSIFEPIVQRLTEHGFTVEHVAHPTVEALGMFLARRL